MAKGKSQEEKILVDTQGRILLFGRPVGIIRKGNATVDAQCQLLELNRFLMARCKSVKFQHGLAGQLEQEALAQRAHLIRRTRVYQLKSEVDPALRFISYQELLAQKGGVEPDCYTLVFDGEVGSDDPETVYRLLRDTPPEGFKGHPLTRSDVLVLYNPVSSRAFYIDTFALKPITFDVGSQL